MKLNLADVEFESQWRRVMTFLTALVEKKPDMNSILFLIGVQELGQGKKDFTKEQKQDLMHLATCKLLSLAGYYELDGLDDEGWPHWNLVQELPLLSLSEQVKLLQTLIIEYFAPLLGDAKE